MLHLYRRVRSTESVSRILSGRLNSVKSTATNMLCPEWLVGGRNLIHTTIGNEMINNNNFGSPNPRTSRNVLGGEEPNIAPFGGKMGGSSTNLQGMGKLNTIGEVLEEERRSPLYGAGLGGGRNPEDEKLDVVHVKLIKNNTFVTVTDSNGNKKAGASSGCLEEMKGGPKVSRYAAEATAEHVGRLAKNLGLKSVVMRVNGFTHFKKKKQAILAWKEGFTRGRMDRSPIMYIEDTTRKAHNGCRLPKQRRV